MMRGGRHAASSTSRRLPRADRSESRNAPSSSCCSASSRRCWSPAPPWPRPARTSSPAAWRRSRPRTSTRRSRAVARTGSQGRARPDRSGPRCRPRPTRGSASRARSPPAARSSPTEWSSRAPGHTSSGCAMYGIANGNTLHAGLGGAATAQSVTVTSGAWRWVKATIAVPSAGEHTVQVWMREDGMHLDRIVLTADAGYTPTGTGPAATPREDTGPDTTPPTLTGRPPAAGRDRRRRRGERRGHLLRGDGPGHRDRVVLHARPDRRRAGDLRGHRGLGRGHVFTLNPAADLTTDTALHRHGRDRRGRTRPATRSPRPRPGLHHRGPRRPPGAAGRCRSPAAWPWSRPRTTT